MQILINRGVVVDAETIEEALEKTKPAEGITVSVNANPRTQPVTSATSINQQRPFLQPGTQPIMPVHLQPKGQ